MSKDEMFPVEKFTLTLRHDYIAPNGRQYELDKPIVATYAITHMPEVPHGVIIEKMLKDLEAFVLDDYASRIGVEHIDMNLKDKLLDILPKERKEE